MRPVIYLLVAIAVCLAGSASTDSAHAGIFDRGQCASGQCAGGQCANGQCSGGQCAGGQCDNGQAAETECERNGKHRTPINVNVDVSPTPVKVNVSPAPVNVVSPAPPAKTEEKPNGLAVAALAVLVFAVVLLGALAVGFHARVTAARKKS